MNNLNDPPNWNIRPNYRDDGGDGSKWNYALLVPMLGLAAFRKSQFSWVGFSGLMVWSPKTLGFETWQMQVCTKFYHKWCVLGKLLSEPQFPCLHGRKQIRITWCVMRVKNDKIFKSILCEVGINNCCLPFKGFIALRGFPCYRCPHKDWRAGKNKMGKKNPTKKQTNKKRPHTSCGCLLNV